MTGWWREERCHERSLASNCGRRGCVARIGALGSCTPSDYAAVASSASMPPVER